MRGALAVAAVLAVIATGCGGSNRGDEDARKAVVAAAIHTTEAGPLKLRQSARLLPGQPRHGRLRLHGSVDGRRRTMRVTMALTFTGPGGATPAEREAMQEMTGDLAQRGETAFLRLPALSRAFGVPLRWFRFSPEDPYARKLGVGGGVSSFGAPDPSRPVDQLRAATDVRRVGTEAGPAGPLTHYAMRVDLARYLLMVPAKLRKSLEPRVAKLERQTGAAGYAVDAWVDEQRLIRRAQFVIKERDGTVGVTARIDLDPGASPPSIPHDVMPLRKLAAP